MPPVLPPVHPDPRYDAHLAPTLADVPLHPRRRLRDGRASSGSSGRGSASGRGPRGTKRSRSTTADDDQDYASLPDEAEASRRLPPLRPRLPRAHVSSDHDFVQLSSDDEPLSRRQSGTSASPPQFVPGSPPDIDEGGPSGTGHSTSTSGPLAAGPSTPTWPHMRINRQESSELSDLDADENSALPDTLPNRAGGSRSNQPFVLPLPRRRSPRLTSPAMDDNGRDAALDEHNGPVLPAQPQHDEELEDEVDELESQPDLNASPQPQAESPPAPDPPADSSFETAANASNRSPSPAQSTDSESSGRRFTAQEKGKGRAVSRPSVVDVSDDDMFDQSIQFIESRPAPPIEINDDDEAMVEEEPPEAAIDEEGSLSAFTCPVCFMAPTAPALTPCGHIMCYGCLHQALIAAIGRQVAPFPRPQAPRRRPNGRKKRNSNLAHLAAGGQYIPPAKWTKDTLEEAWAASQDDHTRRQLAADNQPQAQIDAIVEAQRQYRGNDEVKHELEGLWKLSDTHWVVEGECPVCRKEIPGGLGPLNYRLGSVVLLETRVARAGETEILSLAS